MIKLQLFLDSKGKECKKFLFASAATDLDGSDNSPSKKIPISTHCTS